MITEMTQDDGGAWVYADKTQASIAITVLLLTGWEITGLDDWLNTDARWANNPKNRDELIRLRHRLTETYLKYRNDKYVVRVEAENLYRAAKLIATHVAGYKVARKMQKYSAEQSSRRKGKTVLTESQKKRVLQEYEAAPVTYGMIKSLAGKFNVSEDTISRIVNTPKIQRETNQG